MSPFKCFSRSLINSHLTLVVHSVLICVLLINVPCVRSQSYPDYPSSGPYNNNLETQNAESHYQNEEFPASGGFGSFGSDSNIKENHVEQESFSQVLSGSYTDGQNQASPAVGGVGGLDSSTAFEGSPHSASIGGSHYDGTKKDSTPVFQASPPYAQQDEADVQYSQQYKAGDYGPAYLGYDTSADYEPVVAKDGHQQHGQYNYQVQATEAGNSESFKVPEIPTFHQPFPIGHYSLNDYANPFEKGYEDHGFALLKHGKLKEIGKKELILGIGIFVFLYLILGVVLKDGIHDGPKCESWGWDGAQEWSFEALPRFVPKIPNDEKMQREFLELFTILDKIKHDSSSEEDIMYEYSSDMSYINEMCPRDAFFFQMAPRHTEASSMLQSILVAQHSPADVLHLARKLILSKKINPNVWYVALVGTAIQRPDMTGFALARPVDAMPDRYLPAFVFGKDFDDDDDYDYHNLKKGFRGGFSNKTKRLSHRTLLVEKADATLRESISKTNGTKSSVSHLKVTKVSLKHPSSTNEAKSTRDSSTKKNEKSSKKPSKSEAKEVPYVRIKRAVKQGKLIMIRDGNFTKGASTGIRQGKSSNEFRAKGDDDEDESYGGGVGGNEYDKIKTNKKVSGYGGYGNKDKNKKKKGKGKKGKGKGCLVVDGRVGRDNGIENKLWYWREDIMLNQHHWYWHQAYPKNATRHPDRRGEVFFSMHRHMVARYNAERLSNGLERVYPQPLGFGDVIVDGYNPHMADVTSGKYWTPRAPHALLTDIHHLDDPDFVREILIQDVQTLIWRFKEAIHKGKMITDRGHLIPIRKSPGIEPFANTMEASEISVNPMYYDVNGLHNAGHYIIALISDPEWHHKIPPGVMADQAVSMRDPSFYPYHLYLDNLFEEFKSTLPPHQIVGGEFPLLWKGVEIVDIAIVPESGASVNELTTFFTHRKFRLQPGVEGIMEAHHEKDSSEEDDDKKDKKDSSEKDDDKKDTKDSSEEDDDKKDKTICATHLTHEPFYFKIVIDRNSCAYSKSGQATVRILMAPRYNERGERLPFVEQRRLVFPLDTFQVDLKMGRNVITRRDTASALTQPWFKSLDELKAGPAPTADADFCGCGWPQHLYIPKGNHEGLAFDLFVMVTNFDDDFVADDPRDLELPETCNSPYIFCGVPRRRYPDAKPMGYPFDRPGYHVSPNDCGLLCKFLPSKSRPVSTLEEYVAPVPNMAMTSFGIRHVDQIKYHGKKKGKGKKGKGKGKGDNKGKGKGKGTEAYGQNKISGYNNAYSGLKSGSGGNSGGGNKVSGGSG